MKQAVSYMRMSTDRQEYSIDSQKRLIYTYAGQQGYAIRKEYVDEGISGRNAEKRPQFLQMIEDSAKGMFQYVIIYDSSRFARNLEQSIVYKSILKKNGVSLVSVTEPALDEDTSLITDALLGAMNEMYSRKLSKNVKRGMEQKALRGEFCGNEPFGYRYDRKQKMLLPHPDEAPIVRRIMQEALNGKSSYAIAQMLRKENIRTKAGVFLDRRRVSYILENPVYKGYIRRFCEGRQIVQKSTHQPLISEESFDALQQILQERAARYQRNEKPLETHSHWLSGKLYCSECHCVYSYVKEREHKKARFRCSGQSRGRCSSAVSCKVEVLERQVLAILREIIPQGDELYELSAQPRKSSYPDYSGEIKRLRTRLDRAKNAFLAGIDSMDEYRETKQSILGEIDRITQFQTEQSSETDRQKTACCKVRDLVELLQGDTPQSVKKEVFSAVVEKIVIDKQTKQLSLYFYVGAFLKNK